HTSPRKHLILLSLAPTPSRQLPYACLPYRMRGEPIRPPQASAHVAHFASVVRCRDCAVLAAGASEQHSQSEQHGPTPGAELFGAALTGVGFKLANDPVQAARLSVLLRGGEAIASCTVPARPRGPEASHCESSEAFRGLSVSTEGAPVRLETHLPPPRKMLWPRALSQHERHATHTPPPPLSPRHWGFARRYPPETRPNIVRWKSGDNNSAAKKRCP
ncbi:hypothetical protein TraAM80_05362, partial [Trypanosoma rangeli]